MFISLLEWIDKSRYIRDELKAPAWAKSPETIDKVKSFDIKTEPNSEEKQHITNYTKDSTDINSNLWNHKLRLDAVSHIPTVINGYIKKQEPLHEDLNVYSGIPHTHILKIKNRTASQIIHFPSFISTSMTPAIASSLANTHYSEWSDLPEAHMLKLNLKKGQNVGALIKDFSAHHHEDEYLIKANTLLRIEPKPIIQIHDKKDMHRNIVKTRVHIWNAHIMNDAEIEANKEHPEVKSYLNMKKSTGL